MLSSGGAGTVGVRSTARPGLCLPCMTPGCANMLRVTPGRADVLRVTPVRADVLRDMPGPAAQTCCGAWRPR